MTDHTQLLDRDEIERELGLTGDQQAVERVRRDELAQVWVCRSATGRMIHRVRWWPPHSGGEPHAVSLCGLARVRLDVGEARAHSVSCGHCLKAELSGRPFAGTPEEARVHG